MVFSQGIFLRVLECWSNASTPTWRTRVSLFVWTLTLILSGKGDPTNSYATAGIALGILEVRQAQSLGTKYLLFIKNIIPSTSSCSC